MLDQGILITHNQRGPIEAKRVDVGTASIAYFRARSRAAPLKLMPGSSMRRRCRISARDRARPPLKRPPKPLNTSGPMTGVKSVRRLRRVARADRQDTTNL